MTDIPTVNYSTKLFLQQELSLANHLNSPSLIPIILLLTMHLTAYQQMHNKGPCFFFTLLWQLLIMQTLSQHKI